MKQKPKALPHGPWDPEPPIFGENPPLDLSDFSKPAPENLLPQSPQNEVITPPQFL